MYMKKVILSILCSLWSFLSFAITQRTYTIDYDINSFYINDINDASVVLSTSHDCVYLNNLQQPALPYQSKNILIPYNEVVDSICVIGEQPIDFGFHQQIIALEPNNTDSQYSHFQNAINSQHTTNTPQIAHFPTSPLFDYSVHKLKGYKFANVTYTPFTYIQSSGFLQLYSKISIVMYTHTYNNVQDFGIQDFESIRSLLINPQEVASFYPPLLFAESFQSLSEDDQEDYLMITSEELLTDYMKLAKWKTLLGYKVKIITTDYISQAYDGGDIQEKIKRCIKERYDSTNHNLRYVLLAGDANVIPGRLCYGIENHILADTIPTDLYYACLDEPFTWDADANGHYAESTRDADLDAEVYLSRIPLNTHEDIDNFIRKLIQYERATSPDYFDKLLFAGTQRHVLNDTRDDCNTIINSGIGMNQNLIIDKLIDTESNVTYSTFTPENLQAVFELGHNISFIAAHGATDGWLTQNNTLYYCPSATNLDSPASSYITTLSCYVNNYMFTAYNEYPEFLGRAFLKGSCNNNIGFWGYTMSGWTNYSTRYFSAFYKQIYQNRKKHFAEITTLANIEGFLGQSTSNCYNRYNHIELLAMGDPASIVWTSAPSRFQDVSLIRSNDSLTINANGDSCNVVLLEDADDIISTTAIHENCTTLPIPQHGYEDICLNKDGYAPFLISKDKVANLDFENVTLSNKECYWADNITIGFVSPVVVDTDSKITLKAKSVKVENLNIKKGGQLNIYR